MITRSHSLKGLASIGLALMFCAGLASCGGGGGGSRPTGSVGDQMIIQPRPPAAGAPDLVVASPSVSDSGPADGLSLTLSAIVRNAGDGASPATTLRFYRSTDTTITTADTAVGAAVVPGLAASGSDSASVDLKLPSSPGTYYYGVCVDTVAGESDTTNNCSASVQVTVQETQPPEQDNPDSSEGKPDLTFLAVVVGSGPSEEGYSVRFVIIILNVGDGASAASTLHYYRSTDATLTTSDTQVGTDAVPGLAAAGTSRHMREVLPSSPGTYYYGVCVDVVAGESDTSNNCSRSVEVTVPEPQPDLVVSAAVDDGNLTPSEVTFTLSATVRIRRRRAI